MASNGIQRSLSVPPGEMPRGGPAANNRTATAPGHGRPIARTADDIQVQPNGTLNGHGGRKRHFNRDEPRRHTLGGPRSQMEMKRENSEMEKLERQRQAFLEHLKKKYPQHAQAISGHQKQTRTLSSSHVAEVMEEEDRASVASEQSEPAMGTANTGFSRGSRLRSSLPVVRTPILSKEKSKGIVYLQVNDETKRSIMPNEVTGLDTVRAMFVRAFPHRLTMQIMEQPHIKIYIRDSKSDVYYELEEMKEVQDRACLKIHVPGLAETLPMYHTPSPNSTLSSTTVSNVSLVIEEDGTDSVRNGPSPHPDMARQRQHSPRYQTAVHNTSHQTYQMIKQSNEQKIQQLSNHVSESGSSSEHSTPKQQSPQSTVQRQAHPYPPGHQVTHQSRGPPPPMSGPPKPSHAAPPPPASPRHTQGGPPPPQHQQQQVSRQQTTYYVTQSQAAPQPNIQPPQHGAPHPQAGSPHPQQGSPHPQQGAPHPRTSPHSPHVAQQHATYVYSTQQVPQQRGTPPQGHPQRGTPPQGRPQGHPQGHPGMPAGVPKSASMPNYYQHRPGQGPRPAGPGQPHPIQRSGSGGPPPAHAGRHPGQKIHPSQHTPAMYQRQTSGPGSGGSRASPVMGVQPRGRRSLPHLTGSDVEDEVIQQLRTGHRRGYGSSQTSGTSSPIVNDDEARKRMASIEQQIASLAGLVQTALTHGDETQAPSAAAPPAPGKEEEKGRHPSVTRSESSHSGFSAESVSTVSGRASSPAQDEQIAEKARRLHHTTKGLREQLNQLRIIHRHNAQEMNETFEKVKREIQVRLSRSPSGSIHPVRTQRSRVDLEMHNYRKRAEIVEKKLSELERWVEEVRTDVVNKRCRVSVGDVEAMLKTLSRSEKDWNELQDTWPGLNEELKAVLSAEMEVVVQEERFVKDETDKVEGALKRIKKLTGTLHTLQRLASVQEHRPAQVPVFEQKGEPDQEKLLEEIKGLTPDHERRLHSIQAAEEARERRLRLGSHGPETRKLVEALKEAEETLQQAVGSTDNKDKIEVLIPQESPKVENGSQHSPSGQVLEPGKKVPPPPPPRKNWITSPTSPSPRSPAHSPPIISSSVQYTGKATDLDKAQTSYTTKTITTVFRSATSPTNKPGSTGNHNDNNNQVTNRREGGEGAEKDQRVWFSPTPTTHTIEREEDQDPQEKKRQLQEQYNILQQLQRENMQEASPEPEQLPEQASPTSPTSTSSSDSVASQVQQTRVLTVGNGRLPSGAARVEQNGGGDHRGGTAAVKRETAAVTPGTATVTTGTAAVTTGTAAVTTGTAAVTTGTAAVTPGTAAVTPGTAAVTTGIAAVKTGTAAVKTGTAAVKTVTETIHTVTTDGQVKSETIIY